MTLTEAMQDRQVADLVRIIYTHPAFLKLKDAFVSHSPSAKDTAEKPITEDSACSAHGQYLGTRYVFNKIEELAKQPTQTPKPPRVTGRQDPDLES